ncbi:hypothetical protein ABZP36_024271 [Zizania latifolia]
MHFFCSTVCKKHNAVLLFATTMQHTLDSHASSCLCCIGGCLRTDREVEGAEGKRDFCRPSLINGRDSDRSIISLHISATANNTNYQLLLYMQLCITHMNI